MRGILLRLLLIPPILLLANAIGFCFALLAAAQRAAVLTPDAAAPPRLLSNYGAYLAGLAAGSIGAMPYAASSETLGQVLLRASGVSLGLLGIALLLSTLLGLALGIAAVRFTPPGVALWLTSFATVGLAMPSFFFAGLLLAAALLFVIYSPVGSTLPIPVQGAGWDAHLILPILVLMLLPTARIAQVTASLLAAEVGKPYTVTARSLGHGWNRIMRRYALRNVLAPVAATIVGVLPVMVGELLIVERFFGWPGLGQLAAQTLAVPAVVQTRTAQFFLHPPTLAALLTLFAALFVVAEMLASAVARSLDPRLRSD